MNQHTTYSKCGFWHFAFEVFKGVEGNRRNLITWNSMIARMMLNKESERAVDMFQRLESEGLKPDSATWNSMISGFAQLGVCGEAFKYFREMQYVGVAPCLKIVTSLLSASANSSMLRRGKEIHGFALRTDINRDDLLATALVDIYMKSGHPSWARGVFDQFDAKPDDPAFWNAMIGGYGRNRDYESASEIFLMKCWKKWFNQTWQHLLVIYLLAATWVRCYLDSNLGEEMAKKLLDIEPENPAPLVVLSNIYVGLGRWKEVERIRGMITDKGLDKLSGFSMIELA
ncbi:Pentatricopeptide repeat-containing protein [Glycine soja]